MCERSGGESDPGQRSRPGQAGKLHLDNSTAVRPGSARKAALAGGCVLAGQTARFSRAVIPLPGERLHCGNKADAELAAAKDA
jgi:hypothetical protein